MFWDGYKMISSYKTSLSHAQVEWHPISVPSFNGSWQLFSHFLENTIHDAFFNMDLRRSPRKPVPKTIWEAKGAPSAANDLKITRKTARTAKKTALQPVATGPLPEAAGLDEKSLPELPTYKPPLELEFTPSESLATGLSPLETFQQLLTSAIVDRIVAAINSYAQNARETDEESDSYARPWKPVNSTDIWQYIGCLLHMRCYKKVNREDHWSEIGYLRKFISLVRFDQIHRYFTLRDKTVHSKEEKKTFAWQVKSIASIIKHNCRAL
jgi:Transposase IS4